MGLSLYSSVLYNICLILYTIFSVSPVVSGSEIELTFELQDSDSMCFYEIIDTNVKCVLHYQVLYGGQFDIDLSIHNPKGQKVHTSSRKKRDSVKWITIPKGEYKFCFSNEFSTFAHKIIYFSFQVGQEPPILDEFLAHPGPLTMMESSTVMIHEGLKSVDELQRDLRVRELISRNLCEYLLSRVTWWSLAECFALILVSVAQVYVLRSFFDCKLSTLVLPPASKI